MKKRNGRRRVSDADYSVQRVCAVALERLENDVAKMGRMLRAKSGCVSGNLSAWRRARVIRCAHRIVGLAAALAEANVTARGMATQARAAKRK